MASAAGRVRTNQGETIALTQPRSSRPSPRRSAASRRTAARAPPRRPSPGRRPPARGRRPWSRPGRRSGDAAPAGCAPATAPTRKCTVTAVETSASGQPRVSPITLQEDRRAVEAHAPAEDRQDEGGADHAPSIEGVPTRRAASWGHHVHPRCPEHSGTLLECGAACYGGGRSIGMGRVKSARFSEDFGNGQQCHVRTSRRARGRPRPRRTCCMR